MSLATDLGTAQPLDHALRTCVLAVRVAETAGLDEDVAADAFDVALLHSIGCTSDAHEATALYGDDLAVRAAWTLVDGSRPPEVIGFLRAHVASDAGGVRRTARFAAALAAGRRAAARAFATHCEVAQRLAPRFGLRPGATRALDFVFERWDGKGLPAGAKEDAIPVAARVLHVARDAIAYGAARGAGGAAEVIRERSGTAYDPALARAFAATAPLAEDEPAWAAAMDADPRPGPALSDAELDEACAAAGEFADLKAPCFLGHAGSVAELAEAAAWRLGCDAGEAAVVRRAARLADLGRVAVSTATWERPGALAEAEWERVRLHAHFTERALSRAEGLAPLGAVAGAHHERLDGSGYQRGLPAELIPPPARILAAADAFCAMCEARPHRAALGSEAAADVLRAEAREGRLDPQAVDAVLDAAGE